MMTALGPMVFLFLVKGVTPVRGAFKVTRILSLWQQPGCQSCRSCNYSELKGLGPLQRRQETIG